MDNSANPPEEPPEANVERDEDETLPELHNLNESLPAPENISSVEATPGTEFASKPAVTPGHNRLPLVVMAMALSLAAVAIAFLWVENSRLQAKIDQLSHPSAATISPPELSIVSATYGGGQRFADVTARAQDVLSHPESDFYAHPNWLGADPTPGWNKQLIVIYECQGQRHLFTTGEGGKVTAAILRNAAAP